MSTSSPFFSDDLDPRLTPARADLAASWLKDQVKADQYVDPVRQQISATVSSLYSDAAVGPLGTQALYGEDVDVLENKNGWAWVQLIRDGYVGYMRSEHLTAAIPSAPTHRVSNIGGFIYPEANYKTAPVMPLSYGSLVHVREEKDGFALLENGGFVSLAHLSPIDFFSDEPIAEAFRFLGVPYLWGGRSHIGIDCSALIQLVLQACNYKCPRDSDLQEKHLGRPIDRDDVQGGDLVFFRGHVGLMVDENTLIHANDRSMAVSIDDLDEYLRWRSKNGKTPVKMFKRL